MTTARMDAAAFGQQGTVFRQATRRLRSAALGGLGLFIALSPAAGPVFGVHSVFLREWIMFSGGGIGVLKGQFSVVEADGTRAVLTPLEVLGLNHYHSDPAFDFDPRVFEAADLRRFATQICDGQARPGRLSFTGMIGTRQGWQPIEAGDVCALPLPALTGAEATK